MWSCRTREHSRQGRGVGRRSTVRFETHRGDIKIFLHSVCHCEPVWSQRPPPRPQFLRRGVLVVSLRTSCTSLKKKTSPAFPSTVLKPLHPTTTSSSSSSSSGGGGGGGGCSESRLAGTAGSEKIPSKSNIRGITSQIPPYNVTRP